MDDAPVELWLPSPADALPECLLGRPLLVLPVGTSFFTLVTSSVWTPLTWGDSVRARPHPDGGYVVTGLGAAGLQTRALVTYAPSVPAMRARAIAHTWHEEGAVAIESAPGLFVVAWDATPERIGEIVDALGPAWNVLETWAPEERTPAAIAAHLGD